MDGLGGDNVAPQRVEGMLTLQDEIAQAMVYGDTRPYLVGVVVPEAEWALAWMADLRGRLAAIPPVAPADAAPRSGPVFQSRPHLAFFLHDEVMVHAPAERAEEAAEAVRRSAAAAGRLLFGEFPIDFPLDLRISQTAQKD